MSGNNGSLKHKLLYGMLLAAVLAITFFILGNSFLGYDRSHNTSASVSELILPAHYSENESVQTLLRKAAHLVEFAALGIASMLLVYRIKRDYGVGLYATAFFYVLLVAVLDEHIQSYSDRSSTTGDILLDFIGSLAGFAAVVAFVAVKRRFFQGRKKCC